MADINLNIHNDMPLAGWENDKQPAINALHLNDIENAIFNALKASQYLTEHSSDLNELISLTDNLQDLEKIDEALSTDKTIQTLTDDDKIVLEQLKDLLEKIQFNYDTPNNPVVTIDNQTVATKEWAQANFGQYIYNGSASLSVASTAKAAGAYVENPDGFTCAQIAITNLNYTTASGIDNISIYINQNESFTIGSNLTSGDATFFNDDRFDKVVITLKQSVSNPVCLIGKVEGYNNMGYNYRSIDFVYQPSNAFNLIQVKAVADDSHTQAGNPSVNICYGTPAATDQQLYSNFANIPASSI